MSYNRHYNDSYQYQRNQNISYNYNRENSYKSHNNTNNDYNNTYKARNQQMQPRGNQLYMGDLDFIWNEAIIKQIWSKLGENNVNVKMMWKNRSPTENGNNQNQGYCFVEFPSGDHASNALLKNGMNIPDFPHRKLRLNWASTNASNTPENSGPNSINNHSVFVGDLTPNVTEAQLFELFNSKCPSTEHVKIMYDQATGVSKGYGFVRFGQAEDEQRAMSELQGVYLNGRAIKIGATGSKQQQTQSFNKLANKTSLNVDKKRTFVTSTKLNSRTKTTSNKLSNTKQSLFMLPVQQLPALNHFTDPNNTMLYISNISSHIVKEDILEYFEPFGEITYLELTSTSQHDKNKKTLIGFVQYANRRSAEIALQRLQNYPVDGMNLQISWGRSLARSKIRSHTEEVPQPPFPNNTYTNTANESTYLL